MRSGERPDPPPAPEVFREKAASNELGSLGLDRAVGEKMPGVRRHGLDRALMSVEAEVIRALLLPKKTRLDLGLQTRRLVAQTLCSALFVKGPFEHVGPGALRSDDEPS